MLVYKLAQNLVALDFLTALQDISYMACAIGRTLDTRSGTVRANRRKKLCGSKGLHTTNIYHSFMFFSNDHKINPKKLPETNCCKGLKTRATRKNGKTP